MLLSFPIGRVDRNHGPSLINKRATNQCMSDSDQRLERRLTAIERALDGDWETVDDGSTAHPQDRESVEARLSTIEERLDELDAAVQSVRGFLGGVSAVNEQVEQRADTALAAVERLEHRLDEAEPAAAEGNDNSKKGQRTTAESDETGLRKRLRELR